MCPQTREVQCLLQSMNNSTVKIKSNFQKKDQRPTVLEARLDYSSESRQFTSRYRPFFRWPTNSVTVGKVMIFFFCVDGRFLRMIIVRPSTTSLLCL